MGKQKKHPSPAKFDYESFEKEALSGLQSGRGLVGEEGILRSLMGHLVQSALEGELDYHLQRSKEQGDDNRRNGHTTKRLQTELGTVDIRPPRDSKGEFEPQLVGKWDSK